MATGSHHFYYQKDALFWKIFSKYQNIPDEISDLHLHIDDFKGNIQKDFNFLKEATCKNIENFQASLSSQQTYSVALGSHINNIYHKISELQQQLPHPTQHMNTGDIIQINTPEFDLDIDGRPITKEHGEIQGSDNPIQHCVEETKKSEAPALSQQVEGEVDWPDFTLLYLISCSASQWASGPPPCGVLFRNSVSADVPVFSIHIILNDISQVKVTKCTG